ncbi:MAG: hypothetical protein K9L78_04900, partial [Victivallales bacterium]|nr:hypothetical protein [Victivallales bacterium]
KYDKIAAIHFKMVNQDPGQGYFEISLFATKKDGETIYENNGAWYDNNVQFHKYVNQLPFEGYYGLSVGSGSANNDYVISLGNFQEGHIAKKEASH